MIHLYNNPNELHIGGYIDYKLAKSISKDLKRNNKKNIKKNNKKNIKKNIKKNDTIEVLSFYAIRELYYGNTFSTICEGLSMNKTITTLDLGQTNISVRSLEILAKVFETNTTITSLKLMRNYNHYGYTDFIFKNFVEKNNTLKELYISYNSFPYFGEYISNVIVQAIAKNNTLTTLYMPHCYIDCVALNNIREALEKNKVLTSFKIDFYKITGYNRVTYEPYYSWADVEWIKQWLVRNRNLRNCRKKMINFIYCFNLNNSNNSNNLNNEEIWLPLELRIMIWNFR